MALSSKIVSADFSDQESSTESSFNYTGLLGEEQRYVVGKDDIKAGIAASDKPKPDKYPTVNGMEVYHGLFDVGEGIYGDPAEYQPEGEEAEQTTISGAEEEEEQTTESGAEEQDNVATELGKEDEETQEKPEQDELNQRMQRERKEPRYVNFIYFI